MNILKHKYNIDRLNLKINIQEEQGSITTPISSSHCSQYFKLTSSKRNLQAFCYSCKINSEHLPLQHLATEFLTLLVFSRLSDLIHLLFNDSILTVKFIEDSSGLIPANITIKIPTPKRRGLTQQNRHSFWKGLKLQT